MGSSDDLELDESSETDASDAADKKIEQYKVLGKENELDQVEELLINTFMPFAGSLHTHGNPDDKEVGELIADYTDLIKGYRKYSKKLTSPDPVNTAPT